MTNFTPDRRTLLKGSALTLAAAATMSADQLLGYAKAWAQDAKWKPEAGAYAPHHRHDNESGHGGRIHEFGSKP